MVMGDPGTVLLSRKTEVLWTWGVDIDHTASDGSFPVHKSRLQINVHILRSLMGFETIGARHSSATPGFPPKTSNARLPIALLLPALPRPKLPHPRRVFYIP